MPTRIVPDRAGIDQLGRELVVGEALRQVAERVVEVAKAEPLPHSRHVYRESFVVDLALIAGMQRASAGNVDIDAAWVERGTLAGGRTPVLGYHVLARALDVVASEAGR